MKLTVIVLAAGLSSRMGEKNKLFLPFNGKTLLETTVDNLLAASIGETLVVVGHEAERVKDLLRSREVQIVEHPDYDKGMASFRIASSGILTRVKWALFSCTMGLQPSG